MQVVVWGSTWAAIAVGVADVPPWTFALDRAILVAVLLGGLAIVLRLPFPREPRTLAIVAVSGAINSGISWAVIFWVVQFVPTGLVAVFGATAPIWTALLAHFVIEGERLSVAKLLAVAFGLLGIVVLVMASGQLEGDIGVASAVLLLVQQFGWAASGVLMARYLRDVSPIPAIAIGAAVGGLFLVPFALLEAGLPARWTPEAIFALLYLVFIGSAVGLVVNLWLYRRLRPTTVMLANLLVTVEAILIGALVLGETVSPGMLLGAVLVLIGIAMNARLGSRTPQVANAALPEEAAVVTRQ